MVITKWFYCKKIRCGIGTENCYYLHLNYSDSTLAITIDESLALAQISIMGESDMVEMGSYYYDQMVTLVSVMIVVNR